jgi:hypothetical protein
MGNDAGNVTMAYGVAGFDSSVRLDSKPTGHCKLVMLIIALLLLLLLLAGGVLLGLYMADLLPGHAKDTAGKWVTGSRSL